MYAHTHAAGLRGVPLGIHRGLESEDRKIDELKAMKYKEKITGFSYRGQIGIFGRGVANNMSCVSVYSYDRRTLSVLTL